MRAEHLFHWEWTRGYRWVTIRLKIFFCVWLPIFECFLFLLCRVGEFYDLYRPLSNFLIVFKKQSMLYLKWGLKSKRWPLFVLFLAEQTWKFLHKNPFFHLPSLSKTYELYWPLLRLLLYVRRKLLSSNMKVSLKARLPGTFISCGRLTLYIL